MELNNPYSSKKPAIKVSKKKADELAKNFTNNRTKGKTKAVFFSKGAISDLLKGRGNVGFRVYFGEDENNNMQAVLVAVNSKGDNIVGKSNKMMVKAMSTSANMQGDSTEEDGSIVISDMPCPTHCPKGGTEIG